MLCLFVCKYIYSMCRRAAQKNTKFLVWFSNKEILSFTKLKSNCIHKHYGFGRV